MTKKQDQAIRTLYNDGITYIELNKGQIPQDKQKYLINGRIYTSNAVGTFNEHGSFLCCGPYAVIIKGREAYDKFFEIKSSDLRYQRKYENIDSVFNTIWNIWQNYIDGKYDIEEGTLPKNWKDHNNEFYMIGDKKLNAKYIYHITRFLKPKFHYMSIKGELEPIFFTDGNVIAILCPVRQNKF